MKIYQQDIPGKQAKENIKAGVENYLAKLTESQRQELLGIAGNKAYTNGESWQKYLRGWQGIGKQESRLKGIHLRNMANGRRKSKFIKLTEAEKDFIIKEAKAIGIDEKYLRFRDYQATRYNENSDLIFVSSQIFPSQDDSSIARDRMTVRAVLAHEYYGHRANRNTSVPRNHWVDEFRASYRGAQRCPGLTDDERADLVRDAYDRAKEAGVTVKLTKFARRVLYGF